jgi:hypothetical protein
MNKLTTLASILAMFAASPAFAHPGHGAGGGDQSVLHYLTEPIHLLGLGGAAVATIIVVVILFALRRRERATLGPPRPQA